MLNPVRARPVPPTTGAVVAGADAALLVDGEVAGADAAVVEVAAAVVVVAAIVVVVGAVVVVVLVVLVVVVGGAVTVNVPSVSDEPSHVAVTSSASGGLPAGTVRFVLTPPSGTVELVLVVPPCTNAITMVLDVQVTVPFTLKVVPAGPLFGLIVALPLGAADAGIARHTIAAIEINPPTTSRRFMSPPCLLSGARHRHRSPARGRVPLCTSVPDQDN